MKDVQVAASISSIEAKVDSFRVELESINTHINNFKRQIDELYNKSDIPAEFANFKIITESFIKDCSTKQSSTKSALDVLRSTIESIKASLEVHYEKIMENSEKLPVLDEKISNVKNEFSQKIVSISTAFSSQFNDHVEKQKKHVEHFTIQALSAPKSVIESNKAILDRLEVAALDSSNSMLKANNLETAIKLIERKLENLALQVKKIELSQPIA